MTRCADMVTTPTTTQEPLVARFAHLDKLSSLTRTPRVFCGETGMPGISRYTYDSDRAVAT